MSNAFDPTNPTQRDYLRDCLNDPWPYDLTEVAKALDCEPTMAAVKAALDGLDEDVA